MLLIGNTLGCGRVYFPGTGCLPLQPPARLAGEQPTAGCYPEPYLDSNIHASHSTLSSHGNTKKAIRKDKIK